MRISDWSSDVCSSDLLSRTAPHQVKFDVSCQSNFRRARHHDDVHCRRPLPSWSAGRPNAPQGKDALPQDRKGAVWGKGVSVRVDLGGRSICQKTNQRLYVEAPDIIATAGISDV